MRNDSTDRLLLDLFHAYFDARKHKRKSAEALVFESNYEERIFALHEEISSRRYKIRPSTCFIVEKPVKREIFAADFRDRIVHHLVFNRINPVFERHFIRDAYSCRVGKGTSYGIRRVEYFIRSCSENHSKECWVLKLDISGYFMSMDRKILFRKVEDRLKSVKNPDFDLGLMLYLIRLIVFNDPTKRCRVRGRREDWVGLPKSKSLFFAGPGRGFPIGNLTSQLFANIYLDDFDHFVRETLSMTRYGRYVDDMVFVHSDKRALKVAIPEIRKYLKKNLGLSIHPKKIYLQRCAVGIPFLGVFIKPWRTYVGHRIKGAFFGKISSWGGFSEGQRECSMSAEELNFWKRRERGVFLDREDIEKIVSSVNSYLGIMKRYRTYRLRKKMTTEVLSEGIRKRVKISDGYEKIMPAEVATSRNGPFFRRVFMLFSRIFHRFRLLWR